MKVIWTPRAVDDLEAAVDFIALDRPDAAAGVAERIYSQIMMLEKTPYIGRVGAVPGTRELLFAPLPYFAVYRVVGDAVRVIRIRHAAQDWP